MGKLTIPEYCRKFAVAESTVRYQVRTGKLQSELIDAQIHVIIDDSEIDAIDSKVVANDELIAELRQQVEYLKAENGQLREELSFEKNYLKSGNGRTKPKTATTTSSNQSRRSRCPTALRYNHLTTNQTV